MATRIQLRRGIATEWAAANPVLSPGETGVELDTGKMKAGNGVNTWNQLPYTDAETEYIDGPVTSVNGRAGDVTISAADIGLGNITNVPSVPLTTRGQANGVASLDSRAQVPVAQVPEIPRAKLAAAVQASLDKADANVQYQRGVAGGVAPLDSNVLLPVANLPEVPRAKLAPSVLLSLDRADNNVQYQRGAPDGVAPLDNTALLPTGNLPIIARTKLASDVQASLTKADSLSRGTANGVAPLDGSAQVPLGNIPSIPKANLAASVQVTLDKADAALPAAQKGAANGVAPLDSTAILSPTLLPEVARGKLDANTRASLDHADMLWASYVSQNPQGTLTNTAAPTITGTAEVGQVQTASDGTWSATPTSYTYQWKRNGGNISGATSKTYTTVTADGGTNLTVTVVANLTGYTSGTATSANRAITANTAIPVAIQNTTAPAISGSSVTGGTLTSTTGAWTESPTSYAYQWLRGTSAIVGATSSTYTTTGSDTGQPISVRVVASRSGYADGVASSNSITPAAPASKGGTTWTSDSFAGAALTTMSGQSTDAALGGTAAAYLTSGPTSFGKDGNGHLVPGGTPGTQVLSNNTLTTEHRARWAGLSVSNGSVWIDVRRQSTTVTGDYYSLQIAPATNTAYLINRMSGVGTSTIGAMIPVDVSVPHTYEVEIKGTTLRWWLDDVLVDSVTTTTLGTGNYTGLRMTSASVFVFDTMEVFTGV